MIAATLVGGGFEGIGNPQLSVYGPIGSEIEVRRHDTDDAVDFAIECDRLAYDLAVSIEQPNPECVAENDFVIGAGFIFSRGEEAAHEWIDT